ncbi:serine/threonine protein kinase [Bythopirellula polymerisocia]|uniref:non-specific serine/threonine protein kinase n=1 Tax=Bythopirellula polymerisocia TaxID=2528003 RepID=A0A5C6D3J8_9BACT|nr:serine/threonine-protein kinase [Bythopirellula polymerisocia]TWU30444.1 Serine/threonine-protein kinase PknB [Bythopirellula polymerisocia]
MNGEPGSFLNSDALNSRKRLLESTLAEQRMRWRNGSQEPVEEYLVRCYDLRGDSEAVLDLLYNEVLLRRERGDFPTRDEYLARFPELSGSLGLLFEVDEDLEADGQFLSVDLTSIKNDPSSLTNPQSYSTERVERDSPRDERNARATSDMKVVQRLVASNSFRGTVELHTMLQKRLRFLSILLTLMYLMAGTQLRTVWHMGRWPYYPIHMASVWAVLAIVASIALFLLFHRKLLPVPLLRTIEAILFLCPILQTTFVLFDLTWLQGDLLRSLATPDHDSAYFFHTMVLFYFPSITGYGILIPNTGRRCFIVTLAIGMVPLVLLVLGLPLSPDVWLLHRIAYLQGFVWVSMWMGVGIACATYGCHRINVLQREAFIARRLGQYRLRERLGSGGMGEVYLAEHVLLKQPCAVKIIRPERAGDPAALRRFKREVQSTARLKHWNTVSIYDYGIAADGTFYYAMEYLPGWNLEDMVRSFGPLPPARASHLLRQACAALSEAHAIGLIHRDIKPANLIVCQRGGVSDVVKVLDFGLVRDIDSGDGESLTIEGMIAGTPAYMSPEQASGHKELDARSDVYSLGAVAYFALTGSPPFGERTQVQVLAAHLYETPRPLVELNHQVPSELAATVMRALEKRPEDRFPDTQSLSDALTSSDIQNQWTSTDSATWWKEHSPEIRSTESSIVPDHALVGSTS